MKKSFRAYEYPNVRHSKEYFVYSLEFISHEVLWEVVQTFGEIARRDEHSFKANHFITYCIDDKEKGFISIDGTDTKDLFLEPEEEEFFIKIWGAVPKSWLGIKVTSQDTSAYFAIEFVKRLQKRCPKIAFEYSYSIFEMAFEDEIQKANFIPNDTPAPEWLEEMFKEETEAFNKKMEHAWGATDETIEFFKQMRLNTKKKKIQSEIALYFGPSIISLNQAYNDNIGNEFVKTDLETKDIMLLINLENQCMDETIRRCHFINKTIYEGRKTIILYAPDYGDTFGINHLKPEINIYLVYTIEELVFLCSDNLDRITKN